MPIGYSNYGTGGDSLFRLQLRNALMSKLNHAAALAHQRATTAVNPAGGGMGNILRPTETITATQPTARESNAFNERVRDRALYGRYGKGGIERERIKGNALAAAASRTLTDKQRADIIQKNRELDIKAAEAGLPVPGTGTAGGAGSTGGTGNALGGERIGGTSAGRQPSLSEAAQSGQRRSSGGGTITVPAGAPNAGTYRVPGAYSPLARAARAADPTLQDLEQSNVATRESARNRPIPANTANWFVSDVRAEPAAPVRQPAPVRPVSATPVPSTPAEVPSNTQALSQTLMDMLYRAPVNAIGEENLNAAGNVLADWIWRNPSRATARGANQLSRYVLGGLE